MSLNEISVSRATSSGSVQPADRPPVSRKDLLDAIASEEVFDKLYIELSHKTIQAYQASGRKRCAIKLHAGLAGLEQYVSFAGSRSSEWNADAACDRAVQSSRTTSRGSKAVLTTPSSLR